MQKLINLFFLIILLLIDFKGAKSQSKDKVKRDLLQLVNEIGQQEERQAGGKLLKISEISEKFKTRADITEWVRKNTTLLAYRGVLRGALGVEKELQGNTLDRALFLGAILKCAGFETRLVNAQLEEKKAAELLAFLSQKQVTPKTPQNVEMLQKLVEQRFPGNSQKVYAWLKEQQQKYATDSEKVKSSLYSITEEVSEFLKKQLPNNSQTTLKNNSQILAALRDHWWVQIKEGDAWVDSDTTLSTDGVVRTPVYKLYAADQIPAELYQRVKLRVVAEISDTKGNRREAVLLAREWQAGSATEIQALFGHLPRDALNSELQSKIQSGRFNTEEILRTHTAWVPVINIGGKFSSQSSVALNGKVEEVDEGLLHTMLAAGASVAASSLRALDVGTKVIDKGLLGSLEQEEAAQNTKETEFLVGERLELEIITPGEVARTEIRPIFQISPNAEISSTDADKLFSAFYGTLVFVINFGATNDIEIRRQFGRGSAAMAEIYATILDNKEPTSESLEISRAFEPSILSYASLRWQSHDLSSATYIGEPQIVGIWRSLKKEKDSLKFTDEFDIISHKIEVRPILGTDPVEVRLLQGVGGTVSELLAHQDYKTVSNAAKFLVDDLKEKREWRTFSENDSRFSALPTITKQIIQNSMQQGQTIIAPQIVTSEREFYFFRIDPKSGETLGLSATGRGSTSAEKAMLLGSLAVCFEQAMRPMFQRMLGVGNPSSADTVAGMLAMPVCIVGGAAGLMGRAGVGFAISLIGTIITAVPDYLPHA